jgi:hypothetical protein
VPLLTEREAVNFVIGCGLQHCKLSAVVSAQELPGFQSQPRMLSGPHGAALQAPAPTLNPFPRAARCAPEDLAKERGAVLEEWRMGRSWAGRVQQAHWQLLLQGSKVGARARAPARAPQRAKL